MILVVSLDTEEAYHQRVRGIEYHGVDLEEVCGAMVKYITSLKVSLMHSVMYENFVDSDVGSRYFNKLYNDYDTFTCRLSSSSNTGDMKHIDEGLEIVFYDLKQDIIAHCSLNFNDREFLNITEVVLDKGDDKSRSTSHGRRSIVIQGRSNTATDFRPSRRIRDRRERSDRSRKRSDRRSLRRSDIRN